MEVLQNPGEGRCPHCGGCDLATAVEFNYGSEVGPLGLSYKTGAVFRGTEKLRADLCRVCGTIVRLFVQNTKRDWIQRGDHKSQP